MLAWKWERNNCVRSTYNNDYRSIQQLLALICQTFNKITASANTATHRIARCLSFNGQMEMLYDGKVHLSDRMKTTYADTPNEWRMSPLSSSKDENTKTCIFTLPSRRRMSKVENSWKFFAANMLQDASQSFSCFFFFHTLARKRKAKRERKSN